MSTSDKLQRILDTKYDIRKAISEKGIKIDEKTLFSEYADKIREIAGEMSNGEGYPVIMFGRPTSFVINDKAVGLADCKKIFPFDTESIIAYVYFSDEIIRHADFSNNKTLAQVITLDTNFIESITFENCTRLSNIAPSVMTADPSFLNNLDRAFAGCSRLNSINLSSAYYSECKSFSETFSGCTNLKDIYLMEWKFGTIASLLEQSELPSRDNGDGSIYTTIDSVEQLEDLNGLTPEGWTVYGKVVNEPVVSPDQPSYVNPDFFEWRTNGNTSYSSLFSNYSLTDSSIFNFNDWDVSNVTNFNSMFLYSKFTTIDLSNWIVNTQSSRSALSSMFSNSDINDIKVFNISENVRDLNNVFTSMKKLKNISGLEKWNTENVIEFTSLFKDCESISNISGISNWNTKNITNMNGMFDSCKLLESLDISGWDTSKVKDFGSINWFIRGNLSIESIIGSIDMSSSAYGCYYSSSYYMFKDCNSLKRVELTNIYKNSNMKNESKWSINLGDTIVEDQYLKYIINQLPDLINDKGLTATDKIVFTLPPTNNLTQEQVKTAVDKGWTVANTTY